MVDSTNQLVLLKSVDKGDNWTLIDTRTYKTQSLYYDSTNEKIWGLDCDNDGAQEDFYIWNVTLSDDSITEVGSATPDAGFPCYAYDIWKNTNTYAVVNANSTCWVYDVDAAPFTEDHAELWLTTSYTVSVGSDTYFMIGGSGINNYMIKYDGTTVDPGSALTLYEPTTDRNMHGIAYDGDDTLYFVLMKTADSKNYLVTYSITGDSYTIHSEYNVALMLDRNNTAAVPSLFEKGFGVSNEKVYQIKPRKGGLLQLQDLSNELSNNIIGITDNFLIDDGGAMYEFVNASDYVEDTLFKDGIFPIKKIGSFITHPDNENLFEQGDTIEIFDDSDNREFLGKITTKNRKATGLYQYTLESYFNEAHSINYVKSYTADESSVKLQDIADNSFGFIYRDSSITATTTTYDYSLNRPSAALINLIRFLERQVISIDPGGLLKSEDHDNLTATGKSWDISSNAQSVMLIETKDVRAGYFKGISGITKATVRRDGNVIRTKPDDYAEIEQITGPIPLKEYRDLKIKANTEADQLATNLYTIFGLETEFISLRVEGQGFLQPGETIQIENTGSIVITQAHFCIISFIRDPKNDIYRELIVSSNIVLPGEFMSKFDTSQLQIHQANLQTFENKVAIDAIGGGATVFKTINTPAGTNPVADSPTDTLNFTATGDIVITGTEGTDTVDFSITKYTDAEVEAIITAEIAAGQSIDNAIDALILTHKNIVDAHHAKYTDAEVEAIITAEIAAGQSIDNAIDALVLTHKNIVDAHHAKYTDAEAIAAVAGEDDYLLNAADTLGGHLSSGGYRITSPALLYLWAGTHIDINGKRIISMADPSNTSDGATKNYVDKVATIAIANKRWSNLVLEGSLNDDDVTVFTHYRNTGAGDMDMIFGSNKDLIVNGENLVITQIKFGLKDADANDKIDNVKLYGWSDHTTSVLIDDEDNGGGGWDDGDIGTITLDITDRTIGGVYERFCIRFECTNTDASGLDISFVKIEYYYA